MAVALKPTPIKVVKEKDTRNYVKFTQPQGVNYIASIYLPLDDPNADAQELEFTPKRVA